MDCPRCSCRWVTVSSQSSRTVIFEPNTLTVSPSQVPAQGRGTTIVAPPGDPSVILPSATSQPPSPIPLGCGGISVPVKLPIHRTLPPPERHHVGSFPTAVLRPQRSRVFLSPDPDCCRICRRPRHPHTSGPLRPRDRRGSDAGGLGRVGGIHADGGRSIGPGEGSGDGSEHRWPAVPLPRDFGVRDDRQHRGVQGPSTAPLLPGPPSRRGSQYRPLRGPAPGAFQEPQGGCPHHL